MKKVLFGLLILLVAGLLGTVVAFAHPGNGQEVCPSTDGWTKHEGEAMIYAFNTYNDPDHPGETKLDKLFFGDIAVTDVCVKAGQNIMYRGTYDPAVKFFSAHLSWGKDISHYAFKTGEIHQLETSLNLAARPSGCDTINVNVSWLGIDGWADVEVFITGTSGYVQRFENQMTGNESFTLLRSSGTYTIEARLLDRTVPYTVRETKTVTVTIQPCYEVCDATTGFQFIESILVASRPDGTDVYSDVYLDFDAVDQKTICGRRADIRIVPPEKCEVTTTVYGDWSGWFYDLIVQLLKRTRTITLIDFTNEEIVCGRDIEVQFDDYSPCESENVIVGEWSVYSGAGIDKISYREYIDKFTGEVCNTEYREKCISDKVVHFWTDGWCMFRDRTYPDNASWMVNPPVFMQMAYCGCDYTPFGEWGIVEVNECDEDGYKYWNELTPYCGFENCE